MPRSRVLGLLVFAFVVLVALIVSGTRSSAPFDVSRCLAPQDDRPGGVSAPNPCFSGKRTTVMTGRVAGGGRWTLSAYKYAGLECAELKRTVEPAGTGTQSACGNDSILRFYRVAPSLDYGRRTSFMFGLGLPEVVTVRAFFASREPLSTRSRPVPGFSLRFFAVAFPTVRELPCVVALSSDGAILQRVRRPGSGSSIGRVRAVEPPVTC